MNGFDIEIGQPKSEKVNKLELLIAIYREHYVL